MTKYKSDYEEYLDKYCEKRRISRVEAERHYLVNEYKRVCEERENNGVQTTKDLPDLRS